jgi:hypothetical protein
MSEEKKDDVAFRSAWTGNIVLLVIILIVLGAALAFKEYL